MDTNKQYENLLKVADNVANNIKNEEESSDDEFDRLAEILDQNTDPTQLFPSNNGVEINTNNDPSQNVQAKVLVSANPLTGVLNTIPYNEENITEEKLDKLLELENEDIKRIELDWDGYVESVKSLYPEITDEEVKDLFITVGRYKRNEDFPYFNALPKTIKDELNSFAVNIEGSNMNQLKMLKNSLAKELFDIIINNNYSSKAFTDLSRFATGEINAAKDELGGSVHEFNYNLRNQFEIEFIKKAEELEESEDEKDLEQAAKIRKVSRMYTQSYTYEDMYEAYKNGKIKVKSIQVEKFNRTCSEFNRKYYSSTFNINDVGMTIGVLDRVLKGEYNINCIKKFIVAFINYTKNFTPNNVDEHVFMYYFIQNILALDVKVTDEAFAGFNELVMNNIHNFIELIIERDNQKQEVKKGKKNES